MVKLIMSGSGEGKTKQLLALMDSAAETEVGCMVCIEPTRNMSFNLRHQTRLVDASEFAISNFDTLRGFICGLYAGNYDISHIFIDNLSKIAHSKDLEQTGAFLDWLDAFGERNGIKFTVTISADPGLAGQLLRAAEPEGHSHAQRRPGGGHRDHAQVSVTWAIRTFIDSYRTGMAAAPCRFFVHAALDKTRAGPYSKNLLSPTAVRWTYNPRKSGTASRDPGAALRGPSSGKVLCFVLTEGSSHQPC